jgi:Peptidase A4 family
MVRRWCIPLAGAALVVGSLAASAPAAAAGRAPHAPAAVHQIRPGGRMIRPGSPLIGHGFPRRQDQSTNWSGYAATGSFTSVSANWTEPTGHCTSATRYSSFWVGLDGFNSTTVEQTGSEVDCSGGSPVYYSWYEMYPAFPVNFSNTVRPGDKFFGSVTFNGGSSYTLVLQDITQGWKHTVNKSLSGAANSSAEVIAEAPCCTASGGILPLADFGTVNFSNATANGSAIGNSSPVQIDMIDNSGRLKDQTSSLSGGGSFSDTWLRAN